MKLPCTLPPTPSRPCDPPAPYLLEKTGGAGSFPLWYRLGKSAAEGAKLELLLVLVLVLLLVLVLVLGAVWEWEWDVALGVG
jgi:hypothetical protein